MSGQKDRRSWDEVRAGAHVETLDQDQIVEGYLSAERGDPEPGPNRGRSYWHGWRKRMIDMGALPSDDASRSLAREYVAEQRRRAELAVAIKERDKGR